MLQDSVELVRVGYESFIRGDSEPFVALLDPDVESDISAHPLPDFPNVGRGREQRFLRLNQYLSGWAD